jgi:hypothetical protein
MLAFKPAIFSWASAQEVGCNICLVHCLWTGLQVVYGNELGAGSTKEMIEVLFLMI